MGYLKQLDNALAAPKVVKSVQRRVIKFVKSTGSVSISSVNPAKCMVIVNSEWAGSASYSAIYHNSTSIVTELTATNLTLTCTESSYTSSNGNRSGNYYSASWQVIEFY